MRHAVARGIRRAVSRVLLIERSRSIMAAGLRCSTNETRVVTAWSSSARVDCAPELRAISCDVQGTAIARAGCSQSRLIHGKVDVQLIRNAALSTLVAASVALSPGLATAKDHGHKH